jgi:hypothetical protein
VTQVPGSVAWIVMVRVKENNFVFCHAITILRFLWVYMWSQRAGVVFNVGEKLKFSFEFSLYEV